MRVGTESLCIQGQGIRERGDGALSFLELEQIATVIRQNEYNFMNIEPKRDRVRVGREGGVEFLE